ncbi:MAG: BlaI/MecI/CopY family transcriptional regulator [Candidatus Hydrogenedentales bacterium]|jgi:predicted transcriptional regulator
MLKKHHGLGELELDVLKLVWQTPGSTVQELVDLIAADRACARTTVLTVVQRLHTKGFLTRKKVDGVFRFWGKEEQSKVMTRLIGQFVEKVLDGSAAPFLAYLADSTGLTEAQANKLRDIVREIEKNEGRR